MGRFVLAVIVVSLTFSASGVAALVIEESCASYEQPGRDDRDCPPTCVTCGCCAQAVEPVIVRFTTAAEPGVEKVAFIVPRPPKTPPRDILHVPKAPLA